MRYILFNVRRRGVVGRVPASHPTARVRFRAGSGILIPILGLGMCPLSVFYSVVFGGGSDIVLTTYSGRPALVHLSSVLVHSLLLPLQFIEPTGTWVVSPTLVEGK